HEGDCDLAVMDRGPGHSVIISGKMGLVADESLFLPLGILFRGNGTAHFQSCHRLPEGFLQTGNPFLLQPGLTLTILLFLQRSPRLASSLLVGLGFLCPGLDGLLPRSDGSAVYAQVSVWENPFIVNYLSVL
ncbi:MAG: hypothetical protein AB7D92_07280, partial [Sphaerochaeta sp.]